MNSYGRWDTFDYEYGESAGTRRRVKDMPEGEWECMGCGYVLEERTRPKACPDCGAGPEDFEYYEYDDDDWDDYD
jgi:rubrerythrin